MANVSLDGVNSSSVSNLVFNKFTTSASGSTLTIQAPSAGSSYTSGDGIDLTGNVITNTKPASSVKVGTSTYQPTFDILEFMQSTAALNGSTLQVTPTHSYYYAGSGISIDRLTKTFSNIAQ